MMNREEEILHQLEALVATSQETQGQIEIEARFGLFRSGRFTSRVQPIHFDRLLTFLSSGAERIPEVSTVDVNRDIRRLTYPATNTVIWQRKQDLGNVDWIEYGIRFSRRSELEISPDPQFSPQMRRHRLRYSFEYELLRIDLTDVTVVAGGQSKRHFEVEVEATVTLDSSTVINFVDDIGDLFVLLHGTRVVYPLSLQDEVGKWLSEALGATSPSDYLARAHNIKHRDLIDGPLVSEKYEISHKADGVRKLLVTHSSGVWLVYPPYEYNFLWSSDVPIEVGTVLDGEAVEVITDTGTTTLFLAFDCLILRGIDVRTEHFNLRRQYLTEVTDRLAPLVIEAVRWSIKSSSSYAAADDFYQVVNKYLDEVPPYPTDGLIFTPVDSTYQSQRIFKWKPPSRLSIDLAVARRENVLDVYAYDTSRKMLTLFTGTKRYPLTTDQVAMSSLTDALRTETVVEFVWRENKLVPVRVRHDKLGPNTLSVAIDNWNDIMRPFSEETLRGRDLVLLFRYHNQRKRDLYSTITVPTVRLVDIGSGAGGDVDKWITWEQQQRLDWILAIEPNSTYREELRSRLSSLPSSKWTIVPVGGEASDDIVASLPRGQYATTVTSMLSLSFFWLREQLLDELIRTLALTTVIGSQFLFLTIDGQRVRDLFKDRILPTTMNLATATITLASTDVFGDSVRIDIPESKLVHDQTESLVDVDLLEKRLAPYGFVPQSMNLPTHRPLLSSDARVFDNLYTARCFVRTSLGCPTASPLVPPLVPPTTPVHLALPKPRIMANEARSRELVKQPPLLSVAYTRRRGEIADKAATNDDDVAAMICSWSSNIYRISTISDGSSFFHCVLKATYSDYQEAVSARLRVSIAQRLRRDLALALSTPDPVHPAFTRWQTSGECIFPKKLLAELASEMNDSPPLLASLRVDYTLAGLQRLLNSFTSVGTDIYRYTAEVLNLTVLVLVVESTDLIPIFVSHPATVGRSVVVITSQNQQHQLLAVRSEAGLQTYFSEDDGFIIAARTRLPQQAILSTLDPLTVFKSALIETFPQGLSREVVADLFFTTPDTLAAECDPFVKLWLEATS